MRLWSANKYIWENIEEALTNHHDLGLLVACTRLFKSLCRSVGRSEKSALLLLPNSTRLVFPCIRPSYITHLWDAVEPVTEIPLTSPHFVHCLPHSHGDRTSESCDKHVLGKVAWSFSSFDDCLPDCVSLDYSTNIILVCKLQEAT